MNYLGINLRALLVGGAILCAQQSAAASLQESRHVNVSQGTTLVDLDSVPRNLRRLAAQHVAENRYSDLDWQDAELSGAVRPFFRPDVDGVAYYEFDVHPEGFVLVSAGRHDNPLPHWNHVGESMGERLERLASAKNHRAARLYKLDALSYAAEDVYGQKVAQYGDLPGRIEGLEELRGYSNEQIQRDETLLYQISQTQWESWTALKSGYTATYGMLIDALREEASARWDFEESLTESGMLLDAGDSFPVALLSRPLSVDVTGPGSEHVQGQQVKDDAGRVRLVVRVSDDLPQDTAERVRVAVTGEDGAIDVHTFVVKSGQKQGSGVSETEETANGSWSDWSYYWAGSSWDQCMYHQFDMSGCKSGCGATAWAMLIGWADNQAALGNPYWAPRWGLYRYGGGTGADAVAPKYLFHFGVISMIMEIRGFVHTFCLGSAGATHPADMGGVRDYLAPRTGAVAVTNYNVFGIHSDDLREKVRNQIIYRGTPGILGTGWLSHYPLAWGYAWRSKSDWWGTSYSRYFYVNQGWGGQGDGWVSAGTWFAGELYP